ncbi:hypothetical protein [Gracilibacillus sp. Marseille-QA3620]
MDRESFAQSREDKQLSIIGHLLHERTGRSQVTLLLSAFIELIYLIIMFVQRELSKLVHSN